MAATCWNWRSVGGCVPARLRPRWQSSIPRLFANCTLSFEKLAPTSVQALTFYASRDKLATVGLEDRVEDINRSAVRIAKERWRGDDCLVAGNLSLTWMYEAWNSPSAADRVAPDIRRATASAG